MSCETKESGIEILWRKRMERTAYPKIMIQFYVKVMRLLKVIFIIDSNYIEIVFNIK
jgi:hypothetical protein